MGNIFKKKLFFASILLFLSLVFFSYSLESFFPSTVPEIRIPNTHIVEINKESGGRILRGKAPEYDEDFSDLKNYGVNEVLIFKNDVKGEVEIEKNKLRDIGIKDQNISHIEFKWKKINSFKSACTQTIEAISILQKALRGGNTIFFHCTMGEDRTGYLAGLYIQLTQKRDPKNVFFNEMCQKGYSSGNPNKPDSVVDIIDREITPLFLKMAYKIENGFITVDNLDVAECNIDPQNSDSFKNNPNYRLKDYDCSKES